MNMGFRNKSDASSGLLVAAPPSWANPYMKPGPRDIKMTRQRTVAEFEIWRVVQDRPSSMKINTVGVTLAPEGRRPKSEMEAQTEKPKHKVPILGPTRQQTEIYLKKRARSFRHNVVPADGSAQGLAVGRGTEELPVFDNKAANDVLLEAEAHYRSGYPTLATSTLVRRNPAIDDTDDSHPAIKFFSELVKPVKCRWKFEKEKLKTLAPSKRGFHPRSQSPTFQRLVEANEKLQGLVGRRPSLHKVIEDNIETHSEYIEITDRPPVTRYAKSEATSQRGLQSALETMTPKLHDRTDIKPEIRSLDSQKHEEPCVDEDEDEDEEDYRSGSHTPKQTIHKHKKIKEFKVDFKKMDSHSELHLFLPQIDDAHSRLQTPDEQQSRSHKNTVALPNILHSKEISDLRLQDDDKTKQKQRYQKTDYKKKKKKAIRIKSGNDDKAVRDMLNDVPTLISLEKEKPAEFHSSSMCVFENCAQHSVYRKSSKIRQA